MSSNIGKILILAGVLILFTGILIYFFHDKLSWIGNLPGDIKIEKPGFKISIPFGTMILFSIILSLLVRILTWLNL